MTKTALNLIYFALFVLLTFLFYSNFTFFDFSDTFSTVTRVVSMILGIAYYTYLNSYNRLLILLSEKTQKYEAALPARLKNGIALILMLVHLIIVDITGRKLNSYLLQNNNISAYAEIKDCYTRKGTTYCLYTYDVNEKHYEKSFKNSDSSYGYQEQDSIPILYYPNIPVISRLLTKQETDSLYPQLKLKGGAKQEEDNLQTKPQLTADSNIVVVDLQIEDEISHKLLNDFDINVISTSTEIFKPDTAGHISISLLDELLYTIKIGSKGYISKSIEIDTKGLRKLPNKTFYLRPAGIRMIKEKKGVEYSFYNKPILKASFINDSIIDWDYEYGKKIKEEIKQQSNPNKP